MDDDHDGRVSLEEFESALRKKVMASALSLNDNGDAACWQSSEDPHLSADRPKEDATRVTNIATACLDDSTHDEDSCMQGAASGSVANGTTLMQQENDVGCRCAIC